MREIGSIEEKVSALDIEEGVRKRILDLIEQAKNAEATHAKTVKDMDGSVSSLGQTLDKTGSRLLQMAATMLALRG